MAVQKQKLDEWEVDNALQTLKRAEQIKDDARLMKAVEKQAVKEQKALEKVKSKKSTSKKTSNPKAKKKK